MLSLAKLFKYSKLGAMRYRSKERGVLFITSIVIALVMMLWVVAALLRARHQTATILQSHYKTQAAALAKTAMSYALFRINVSPAWLDEIKGADPDASGASAPWKGIEGASVWAKTSNDGQLTLVSRAEVDGQTSELSVPLLKVDPHDTTALSIIKSTDGQDVISRNPISATQWDALPPIPGLPKILSAAGANNGEIYAVTDKPAGINLLWRYRTGHGWVELIDPPEDGMKEVAIYNSQRLVTCNENSLMVLPLDSSMEWRKVGAPSGQTIDKVTIPMAGPRSVYALTNDGSGKSSIFRYDLPEDPKQELNVTDWRSGPALPGGVSTVDGGLGVDSDGRVYIAVNSASSPSRVFRQGAGGGGWQELPPVPFFQWSGGANKSLNNEPPPVQRIEGLQIDDSGSLWVHAKDPNSAKYINILVENVGAAAGSGGAKPGP